MITNAKLIRTRSSCINDPIMDGYSLVYLKTSFFVIIPRRRPLWVTRVWEEFFTDYDMKASQISWYQLILQPPTWRRPSLRNMSTTVSMGVWKGRHWYKVLGCKTLSCHSLESDLDLVGDSDWGKIDNLPQLDRRRAASYHWHVVGENTKAGGESFFNSQIKDDNRFDSWSPLVDFRFKNQFISS